MHRFFPFFYVDNRVFLFSIKDVIILQKVETVRKTNVQVVMALLQCIIALHAQLSQKINNTGMFTISTGT